MTMHVSDVRDRLARIEHESGDPESAHGAQDDLFREVLAAIASGDIDLPTCRAIANEALKVDEIKFSRWYA